MQNQSPISKRRWGFFYGVSRLAVSAHPETPIFLLPLDGEGWVGVIICRNFRRERLEDLEFLYNIRQARSARTSHLIT
jgi:hypothetical protein